MDTKTADSKIGAPETWRGRRAFWPWGAALLLLLAAMSILVWQPYNILVIADPGTAVKMDGIAAGKTDSAGALQLTGIPPGQHRISTSGGGGQEVDAPTLSWARSLRVTFGKSRLGTYQEVLPSKGVPVNWTSSFAASTEFGNAGQLWYFADRENLHLAIRSVLPVSLLIDVNRNGKPDPDVDLTYAATRDGRPCVEPLPISVHIARCGSIPSDSVVTVRLGENLIEYDWAIPKRELPISDDRLLVALQVFDPATGQKTYYPANPFERPYALRMAAAAAPPREPEPEAAGKNTSAVSGIQTANDDPLKPERVKLQAERARMEQERQAEEALAAERKKEDDLRAAQQQKTVEDLKAKQAEQERELQAAREREEQERLQNEELQRQQEEQQRIDRAKLAQPKPYTGPSSGMVIWEGNVVGTQMITIENGRADLGSVTGLLPGVPVLIQPTDAKRVVIASSPGPRNGYNRVVLRVAGKGHMRITLRWSLP